MSLSNATWQRSIDLAGEIKQARAIIDECAGACLRSAALHEADRVSLDRANERHQALLDERAELAQRAHADVMACGEHQPVTVGDVFGLPGDVFNVPNPNGAAEGGDIQF